MNVESFYYMQRRIDDLLQQEYESGKAVKQAELRALRAQINPHFLYNTLDLINWEAMDCGSQKIMEMSRAMAKFYKLSLNRGKEFSSIREEIEHVSYYIQIQNLRYDNRLKLELEIPEELYDLRVLHIVLQPLVENSLLHGMAGRSEEEELHLVIVAQRHGSDLFITVDDNGIGMEQKQMDEILQEKASADSGYGVQNIHARIQLVYGSDYGLTYSTSDRGGVRVTLHFPCQNMKGEPV